MTGQPCAHPGPHDGLASDPVAIHAAAMSEPNPFAAPADLEAAAAKPVVTKVQNTTDLAAALRRLDEHTADPTAVAQDRAWAGGRLGTGSWVTIALIIACLGLGALAALNGPDPNRLRTFAIFAGVAMVIAVIGLFIVIRDLRMATRTAPGDPVHTLRSLLGAMMRNRTGYVLASLAPSAREQEVDVPDLAPVITTPGTFVLNDRSSVKQWLRGWIRPDRSTVRWMKLKTVRLAEEGDRFADVEVTMRLTSWPQWANIVSVVLFVFIRLIGIIVGLVLWYSLRKVATVTVTKRLIQDHHGVWYLLDPGLGEDEDGVGAS